MSKGTPQWQQVYTACKAFVWPKLWQLNLLEHSQDPPGQAEQLQQQTHCLFEGQVIPSLRQRREAAAEGLTCRLLFRDVKQPLESLTPKETPTKGASGGPQKDLSNSTNTNRDIQPLKFGLIKPFGYGYREHNRDIMP